MGTFDGEQQDALELITEFGENAQLKKYTTTTPDNAKPWETGTPALQTQMARMVFLNFTDQSNSGKAGERYFEGTLVQTGDKKVLVAALGLSFDPEVGMALVRADGTMWKVENVKGLDPNGQQILFTILARQ